MYMKSRVISLLAVGSILASSGLLAQAADTDQANVPVSAVPANAAPPFSGRINDVVSLTKSGVEDQVVISYIKTSPGPFQPSADEIIKLRDDGVSSQVITAMLQRGAELREQTQAVGAQQNYAQSTAAYTQPAQVVTPPATYVDPTYYPSDYVAPSSSVVYIGGNYGYPYGYCYPYSYPYYYSGYCGPSFTFGFGGFRGFRGFHDFDHFHGGFHGGTHFVGGGFHGGGFVGGGFHGGGDFHGGGSGGFHGGSGGFHGGGGGGGFHGGHR
jgi:hypothetical protein